MKFPLLLYSLLSLSIYAQSNDPILMNINGKTVTRSAFEYSYNKNRANDSTSFKDIEEYAQRFLNYKLKVEAAREIQLDTLPSFRQEFQQYRDQLLTSTMVDQFFIDSVTSSIYERMSTQVRDKGLCRVAHILIRIPQTSEETIQKQAFIKADSLALKLRAGADFATIAKTHSEDFNSAKNGGELPWFGQGETFEEFERVAFSLQPGEISTPFLSPAGYHIVRMIERKLLDSYDVLKPQIIASLKRQNIEEYSANERINRIITTSQGKLTREMVLDSIYQANLKNPEIYYLVQEYEEGLLLYEISNRTIWEKAQRDTNALQEKFKTEKTKYKWNAPHFKGLIYLYKDKSQKKVLKSFLKEHALEKDWQRLLKTTFNKDSVQVAIIGPLLVREGDNPFADEYVFKKKHVSSQTDFPFFGIAGKTLTQPQTFEDIREQIVEDYQKELETEWIKELRQKYPYSLDLNILRTVNQH